MVDDLSTVGEFMGAKNIRDMRKYDKTRFLAYLAKAEGIIVHKNKNEKTYTTPFGLYKKYNKDSELIRYIDKKFKEFGKDSSKGRDRVYFNKKLAKSRKMRYTIERLAWKVIKKKYINNDVLLHLGFNSSLTFFSLGYVGSPKRANKALQYALGVTIDGQLGKISYGKLRNTPKGDNELNQLMLEYMDKYFKRLIKLRPDKYLVNKRGWLNRLYKLGYKQELLLPTRRA